MQQNIIFVKNYETYCSIGIYPNEKKNKQKIRISIKLGLKKVGKKDKLNDTVSYETIIEYLEKIEDFSHFNLVETLALKTANHFTKFKMINLIEIEIVKLKILKQNTDVGFFMKKIIK